LQVLLGQLDEVDPAVRDLVFELLDGVDLLHRSALRHLGEALGAARVEDLAAAHPAIAWLFEAYAVGIDERAAAEDALDGVRPYIDSHGGQVEVLHAADGVVRLRMGGACAGCTASAETLRDGIEEALREGMPGFLAVEVEMEDAAPHPPPSGGGLPLVQITAPPR
jgi:Fe-S cluster biogenesis protein NfuA